MTPPPMAHDTNLVELRGMAPRDLVEVLDVISASRRQPRIDLVLEILQAWVDQRVHEASLVHRLSASNPRATDSARKLNP